MRLGILELQPVAHLRLGIAPEVRTGIAVDDIADIVALVGTERSAGGGFAYLGGGACHAAGKFGQLHPERTFDAGHHQADITGVGAVGRTGIAIIDQAAVAILRYGSPVVCIGRELYIGRAGEDVPTREDEGDVVDRVHIAVVKLYVVSLGRVLTAPEESLGVAIDSQFKRIRDITIGVDLQV